MMESEYNKIQITPLATTRLKETGLALGLGLGLAVIGKPVTYIGSWMQNRENLCRLGEQFTRNEL